MARGRRPPRNRPANPRANPPQMPACACTVTRTGAFQVQINFDLPVIVSGIIDLHLRNSLISPNELKAVSYVFIGGIYIGYYQNNLSGGGTTFHLYSYPLNVATKQGGGLVPQTGVI